MTELSVGTTGASGMRSATADNHEIVVSHPDRTDTIDRLHNPLKEMAEKWHALGAVIEGYGVGTPVGSLMQFGDVVLPNILLTARACAGKVYAAVTWSAVRKMYTTPRTFSSKCFVESLGRQGPTLTTMDTPEHTKYRKVAQSGFLPAPLAKYDAELIRPIIARRFAELRPKGGAELVRELTTHMAFEINGSIIGFDPVDVPLLAKFKKMAFSHDQDAVAKASEAQNSFTTKLIDDRRAQPKDDLISFMVQQDVDGEPVAKRNLLGLVNVLLAGGIDTTYKQSGNIISLLLDNPEQFDLLRANRGLIPNFVDESVRYEGVATDFPRIASEDTVPEGTAIAQGSIVFGMIFAADRDPSRWQNPHVLDATRPPQPILGFSTGAHSCIGSQVARKALACLIEHLIDDLPNFRWDPAKPHPKITGWNQRTVLTLPVIWDAA